MSTFLHSLAALARARSRPVFFSTRSRFQSCHRAEVQCGSCLQVDVTLSGHDHKYERTCPVYKKNCLPYDANGTAGGPTHVVRPPFCAAFVACHEPENL